MRNFMEKPETADFSNTLGVREHKMTVDELLFLQLLQMDLKEAEVFIDPSDNRPKAYYYHVEYIGPAPTFIVNGESRIEKIQSKVFLTESAISRYFDEEFPDLIEREYFQIYKVSVTLNQRLIKLFNILSTVDFVSLISLPSVTKKL